MQSFIITDDTALGERLRSLLGKEGLDCPSSNVLPLRSAAQLLASGTPDLIAIDIQPDADRALAVILTIKGRMTVHSIAIGPVVDPKLVLKVLRNGIDDFVDIASLEAELNGALHRLKAKLARAHASGKVISLVAPNGGCGSSTLAANLAVGLAQQSGRTLLVDLHLYSNDLASLLDLKPIYSLADFCQNLEGMDRSLFEKVLTPHASGVQLLGPPQRISEATAVTPAGVCLALMSGRAIAPYIIVDVDMQEEKTMQEVFIQSDLILLVLKPDVSSLRNARRLIDYLEWLGVLPQSVRIVLTRVGQPNEIPLAKVDEAFKSKVFHAIPEDLKVINNCNNAGLPAITEWPRSKYAQSVAQLVGKTQEALRYASASQAPANGDVHSQSAEEALKRLPVTGERKAAPLPDGSKPEWSSIR